MNIKSLGMQSDIMFYQWTSIVTDKGDYLKIETPQNPKYFWGNLLIFKNPPGENDFEKWTQLFKDEFQNNAEIEHMTFCWDVFGAKANLDKFISTGFKIEETIVLTTQEINCEYSNSEIVLKEILTQEDWREVIELQFKTGIEIENYKEDVYRPFIEKKFQDYKDLINSGRGKWFGAYSEGKLVSDLGLFGNEKFMRFQSIETATLYRKKGIAQTLMKYASNHLKSENYIIQALQNGPAIDMYMKIGFEIKEVLTGVCLYNMKNWKKS